MLLTSAVFAIAGLMAAGGALFAAWQRRSAPVMQQAGAVILTDRWGRPRGQTDAATRLLARNNLPPDATSLMGDASVAAALFALRRMAAGGSPAEGEIAPSLKVRVREEAGGWVHTFFEDAPGGGDGRSVSAREAKGPAGADAFVAALPVPAAVVDTDGTVVAANDGFEALLGPCRRLVDQLALEAGALARLSLQAEGPMGGRLDAALVNAPDRRVRIGAKPFGHDHLIVAVTDVTVHSELEAQVAQSQKMQAIGQLAGGIAHDFNNVLTAIIGFSDLLLQNHRPSDPAFRDILNIKQSAQRAAGLVKQLLAFSRRQTLRPTVLNLNDVLADLLMMLDRLLGETIRLDISYGRDLWPVRADLSQIEQVVINLAVNARDAMPGGGQLTIRTRNVAAGSPDAPEDLAGTDAVLVEIEDVGTGMPQHVLDKIFEP
ncbi:MAG: histidine kinase dimerization/phospho-acceptor domain-containing protein, partial [Pseudomonadota bacterium]